MKNCIEIEETLKLPRLPLEGNIDLTYCCNNNCRHGWLWLPANAPEQKGEFSFDEIRRVIDEARALGCHRWSISGGEPLLRPDFAEIFDCITRKATTYSLNTNGTLITPDLARLLKRRGRKMTPGDLSPKCQEKHLPPPRTWQGSGEIAARAHPRNRA